jgi:hypothetical protein
VTYSGVAVGSNIPCFSSRFLCSVLLVFGIRPDANDTLYVAEHTSGFHNPIYKRTAEGWEQLNAPGVVINNDVPWWSSRMFCSAVSALLFREPSNVEYIESGDLGFEHEESLDFQGGTLSLDFTILSIYSHTVMLF